MGDLDSDLGRRLQCELARYDRLSSCMRVDPKTENAGGHERFTACASLHTVVAELDLTVTNTWMDADSERELDTRHSRTGLGEAETQMTSS